MSKYSKYDSYKDSGVAWLGDVPENWTSIKFKQALMQKKKTTNNQLDCGSISFGTVVYKDNDKIPEETRDSYQEVLVGEFLINPLNLNFDLKSLRTALSTINVVVSTGYIVLQSKSNIEKNYLRWLLYQFDVAHMKTLGAGVRQTVNYTDIGNEYFHMPMISDQQAIANYLDIATDKIDTLISKQTKLIELLKEKRQALISHAVTKGLNPHAKMKQSGVEWLGNVPEHWLSVSLKWISKIYSGGTPDKTNLSYWTEGSIPWISSGEVNQFYITTPTTYITEEAYSKSSAKWIPKDALVMALAGQGKTKGMVAQLGIKTTCNQSMAAIILSYKIYPRFILWWLSGNYENIRNLAGGDLRDGLNLELLGGIFCPFIELKEQQAIANYLDDKTSKIDNLMSKATKAINLLKEKRTALISSAVTGKIDVREIA